MKKKITRAEMGHIFENVGLQGVASNNLIFFLTELQLTISLTIVDHILAKIN